MICARNRKITTYRVGCVVVVCILAGGCSNPQSFVFTKLATPDIPPECLSSDPKWQNPPEEDIKADQTARLTRSNKEKFNSMRHDRSICRAGLKAIQKEASNG